MQEKPLSKCYDFQSGGGAKYKIQIQKLSHTVFQPLKKKQRKCQPLFKGMTVTNIFARKDSSVHASNLSH